MVPHPFIQMLTLLAAFFPEKPDLIYASLITALTATVSVWLTHKYSLHRQKLDLEHAQIRQGKDLKHSAEEKEAERVFELKRDIYLPAIEDFTVATSYASQIPVLAMERIYEGKPILDLARSTGRLALIAPKDVLTAVHAAVAHLLTNVMTLTRERLAIAHVEFQLDGLNKRSDAIDKKIAVNMDRMDAQIASGKADTAVMKYFGDGCNILHEELDKIFDEKSKVVKQRLDDSMTLLQQAVGLAPAMAENVANALLAIRNEIKMPLDHDWYIRFTRETVTRMATAVKEYQANLHSDMKQKMS